MNLLRNVMTPLLLLLSGAAIACTAESGKQRVPLLELYTSEGCNSCPPADRWLSMLSVHGLSPHRVLALAFHVDYWNHLGWEDPFARPEFSERQRDAARRNRARLVYTPQFLLDGADYRRSRLRDDFTERLAAIGSSPAIAFIRAGIHGQYPQQSLHVTVSGIERARRSLARVYWAIYENRLASAVSAGENRGKRLEHDAAVRHLAGPYSTNAEGTLVLAAPLRKAPDWKIAHLHLAIFVQDAATGETLQALSLPWCNQGP
jgi:hypothetical protein